MPARSSLEGTFGFGIPVTGGAPRVWTPMQDGNGSISPGGGAPISFFIIGPNDSGGNGWTAVKSFFAVTTVINYTFSWSTTDGINWDWPFAIASASEPFSFSGSTPKIAATNSQSGSGSLTIPAGQWAAFGVYSVDRCCGDGRCTFSGLPAT